MAKPALPEGVPPGEPIQTFPIVAGVGKAADRVPGMMLQGELLVFDGCIGIKTKKPNALMMFSAGGLVGLAWRAGLPKPKCDLLLSPAGVSITYDPAKKVFIVPSGDGKFLFFSAHLRWRAVSEALLGIFGDKASPTRVKGMSPADQGIYALIILGVVVAIYVCYRMMR